MPLKVCVTQNSMLFRFDKLKRWATFCYHPPLFLSTRKRLGSITPNFSEEACHGVPARSDFLFSDRRPARASSAEIRSVGGVGHRQRGGMGHPRSYAAHGAAAAGRRASYPRCAQLRLV